MITNEILQEKYRVQKKLSEGCTDIHDYFDKAHQAAELLSQQYGIKLKYEGFPKQHKEHLDLEARNMQQKELPSSKQ